MKKLEGKVAVITGGNSGIGLAAAQQLVADGAFVFITGRRKKELDEAVKLIGRNVMGFQGDVSIQEDLDRLYSTVKEKKGKIDVLFANAGISEFSLLENISEEHFDRVFNINVKGLLFTVQKALPLFNDGGSIILNASIASCKGLEALSVYCGAKAAVRAFARCWILELKKRQIRVNVVSPGPIKTPIFNTFDSSADEIKKMLIEMIPMGRIGKPEEIAKAVSFLASSESSFINGIELFVDGGAAQF